MTVNTVLAGRNMPERLTGNHRCVMAGFTIIRDARMGERHIQEVQGAVMTILARLGLWISRYVVCQFADTDPVVVAYITATGHVGMIIGTRSESPRGMTVGTVLVVRCRRHVCVENCSKRFAAGSTRSVGNVTAVGTAIGDAGMIDAKSRREALGVMA